MRFRGLLLGSRVVCPFLLMSSPGFPAWSVPRKIAIPAPRRSLSAGTWRRCPSRAAALSRARCDIPWGMCRGTPRCPGRSPRRAGRGRERTRRLPHSVHVPPAVVFGRTVLGAVFLVPLAASSRAFRGLRPVIVPIAVVTLLDMAAPTFLTAGGRTATSVPPPPRSSPPPTRCSPPCSRCGWSGPRPPAASSSPD
jgi:hypothetical protein